MRKELMKRLKEDLLLLKTAEVNLSSDKDTHIYSFSLLSHSFVLHIESFYPSWYCTTFSMFEKRIKKLLCLYIKCFWHFVRDKYETESADQNVMLNHSSVPELKVPWHSEKHLLFLLWLSALWTFPKLCSSAHLSWISHMCRLLL